MYQQQNPLYYVEHFQMHVNHGKQDKQMDDDRQQVEKEENDEHDDDGGEEEEVVMVQLKLFVFVDVV